jgi:hypothetical protein
VIVERFFPDRWARITVWTGAAVAWATSLLVVQAAQPSTADATPPPPQPTEVPTPTTALAAIPEAPDQGLVVIRFTPTPPPPPQVITRTVTVGGGGGAGGGGAAPPVPPVKSSGS